jgi:uncharacterized delta-60 repeat protein
MREKRGLVHFVACVLCLLLAAPAAVSAAPQLRGQLDRSFGNGGGTVLRLGPTFANSLFEAMVRQPDGSILLAGETEFVVGNESVEGKYNASIGFVQRRKPTGEVDTGFGGGLVRVPGISALALQDDGRVLAGVRGPSLCLSSTVRRLGVDGSPDPSFGEGGESAEIPISVGYIAVDAQDRIVVAGLGAFSACGKHGTAESDLALARLFPDGTLDRSFGQGGVVRATNRESMFAAGGSGLTIREDGTILVAGYKGLYAFTPAGTPDPSFGTNGVVEVDGVPGPLLGLPDGRVVLASSSAEGCCDKPGHFVVSRYLPNGSLDPGFGGGTVTLAVGKVDVPTALAVRPEGSVLLGGETASTDRCPSLECDAAPVLVRFTAGGSLDAGFGQSGRAALGLPPRVRAYGRYIAALAVTPEGRALVAGGSGDEANATLSALRPDGSADAGFGSGGRVADVRMLPSVTEAWDIAMGPSGTTLVSALSNAGAHRERGILLSGAPGSGPKPLVEKQESRDLQVDGHDRFYSLGWGYVTRFDETGQPDLSYGIEGKAFLPPRFDVEALVVRRSGQALVVGRVAKRFGMAAFMLTPEGRPARRFGGDGLAIVGFGKEVRANARTAAFDRHGRIVLFGDHGPYAGMARLLPNGRPDPRFAYGGRQYYMPGLANEKSAVGVASDGKIFVAAAPEPNRDLPTTLIRFRPDGIRDRAFGHNGVVRVDAGASMFGFFLGRRLILVSGAGEYGVAIRAFRRNGSLDRRFGRRGVATARIQTFRPAAAARQRNGKIVVAGTRGSMEESGSSVELLRFR